VAGEAKGPGLVAFVPKPYTADALLRAVDKILRPAADDAETAAATANRAAELPGLVAQGEVLAINKS
jgi:hypothetical protein